MLDVPRVPAHVECVSDSRALLGECPCWDPRSNKLFWVDIKGKRFYCYEPENDVEKGWDLPYRLCSLDVPPPKWSPDEQLAGTLFLGCSDMGFGWVQIQDHGVSFHVLANPESDQPENRFNDGKTGPDGRYWAGTMHDLERLANGNLYAFDRHGNATLMDCGYQVTNGPAFSLHGSTIYHTDSARQVIYAFNITEDGFLKDKRNFVSFSPGEGFPDGMTTDAHGNLWVAIWDGGRIEKISSLGERMEAIRLPTQRPTSCIFTDKKCTELYVTSACIDADPNDALAGSLFKVTL